MAVESGDIEDALDGPNFTIGSPSSPVPQSGLKDRYMAMDKGVPAYDEVDYQSHRNVFVAVHVPYSYHKKHKHKKHKHHHHHHKKTSSHSPEPQEPKTPVDPCDRVKFILETEEGEGEVGEGRRESHSLFTELEELRCDHHNRVEWKETARWVKFEEDVEEGGNKWSKPHVATLSLHSLFELRSCIIKGTVLLDLEATDLGQIADYVLDSLVDTKQLQEDKREKVRAALLLRHKHQSTKDHDSKLLQNIRSMADIGRIGSSGKHMEHQDSVDSSTQSTQQGGGSSSNYLTPYNHPHPFPISAPSSASVSSSHPNMARRLSSASNVTTGSGTEEHGGGNGNGGSGENGDQPHDPKPLKPDTHFMKKIPPGSEASNVLVGEVDFLSHAIIAFVRLKDGVLLGDITEVPIPTRFLFIMLGPKGNTARYHEVGRSIATLMSDEVFHDVAYKARNRDDLLAGVDEFLDKVTVLPPGEWDPTIRLEPPPEVPSQAERRAAKPTLEPEDHGEDHKSSLICSKIPFSGLVADVKRRYPKYWSDIKDAFSIQVLASIIFIFFANITPAITFGGVLADITENQLGALEMIAAVGLGNVVYSLTAGQPLVVLGGTGPTLIFEDIVYKFSKQNDVPYLNFRFWIGMWVGLFMIGLVAFNASAMMRLFTRFTEEIFSALISFIFIYEAFDKVWKVHLDFSYNEWILRPTVRRDCDCYEFSSNETLEAGDFTNATRVTYFWDDPNVNCSEALLRKFVGTNCDGLHGDVFLMSVILFFGTFLLSFYLKKFRGSNFFSAIVRHIISDFAVFLAVIVWVVVDILADIDTPKLIVPNVFTSGFYSNPDRGFIINPLGNGLPSWAPIMAVPFAILATILLFMDQQITALIVNRKDHKLKKGSGYHLDLLIVGIMIVVHSVLGIPWVVGATVRSITHVQSLFILSPCTAPGERPKFIGVREQRVTLFVMAVLLGTSIMLYYVLRLLPLPILYGIFLYIGVASLYGVQFVQRLALPLIPDKYKPDYNYLRRIPNIRIHAYTLYQVAFFLLLCIFKVIPQISIVFPIMVLMLVGARWLAGLLFRWSDLELLDDPIPERLYCQHFRHKNHAPRLMELEGGGEGGEGETELDDKPEASNGTHKPGHKPPAKRKSDINMTQAVDNSGIWKNMVRKLEAPLQSPRRRSRFKPTPLDPIIVEEESDLLSPRSPVSGVGVAVGGGVTGGKNTTDSSSNDGARGKQSQDLSVGTAGRYQVTSV